MDQRVFSRSGEMEKLFRSLSVRYILRSEQSVSLSLSFHYEKSSYYKRNRDEFLLLTEKYSVPVLEHRFIASSVGYLDSSLGRGLFAEQEIGPDDFIGEYAGLIQFASPCRPAKDSSGGYETDYSWTYPERKGFRNLEVNGRLNGNEARFINHSFTPNCRMEHTLVEGRWVLFLLAERSISVGEQLTVDYGEEYWTGGFRELIMI